MLERKIVQEKQNAEQVNCMAEDLGLIATFSVTLISPEALLSSEEEPQVYLKL